MRKVQRSLGQITLYGFLCCTPLLDCVCRFVGEQHQFRSFKVLPSDRRPLIPGCWGSACSRAAWNLFLSLRHCERSAVPLAAGQSQAALGMNCFTWEESTVEPCPELRPNRPPSQHDNQNNGTDFFVLLLLANNKVTVPTLAVSTFKSDMNEISTFCEVIILPNALVFFSITYGLSSSGHATSHNTIINGQ